MTDGPIKVMIVDDHAVVRSGLSAFLMVYDDLEFVGEAGGGAEAVRRCRSWLPTWCSWTWSCPTSTAPRPPRLIRDECPHVQVIALTSYKEEELVQGALKAGAISYLLKNVTADELAQAIRAAYAGRSTLAPEAAQVLIRATTHPEEPDKGLTARELEILRLMVDGMSNPEIAKRLFVSRSTVKFHVSNILMKLGAGSRTEAVSMAIHEKLVD